VSMAMWGEAIVFGEAVGLEWRTTLQVMAMSAIGSPLIRSHTNRVAERDFTSPVSCDQMAARLGEALAHGKATGTVLMLAGQAHQMFMAATRNGRPGDGLTAVLPWLERAAGTQPDPGHVGSGNPAV
jgi:2-hydroxy-3-oxopropionate reductase